MNIVVVDDEIRNRQIPVELLVNNRHNVCQTRRLADCYQRFERSARPYIVMANYKALLAENSLSNLFSHFPYLQFIKGLVVYGDLDESILLSMKGFSKKLGLCNVYSLGAPVTFTKITQLISAVSRALPDLEDCSGQIEVQSQQKNVVIDATTVKPYYQPKVSSNNKQVVGYEVLGRLLTKERTLSPGEFLDEVIANGMITKFTYLMVYNALDEIAGLRGFDGTLSFNIDYRSLDDNGFFDRVTGIFKALGFPFERAIFEITERNPIYSATVIETLTRLKSAGFGISIDDFGMADSGFTQLLSLPFTEIKIDRSYIAEMQHSDYMLKVVKALASVASCMEVNIVAEGVENRQQIDILKSIKVDTLQGFYFSRPHPIEKLHQNHRVKSH